jgi:hypothetical protein
VYLCGLLAIWLHAGFFLGLFYPKDGSEIFVETSVDSQPNTRLYVPPLWERQILQNVYFLLHISQCKFQFGSYCVWRTTANLAHANRDNNCNKHFLAAHLKGLMKGRGMNVFLDVDPWCCCGHIGWPKRPESLLFSTNRYTRQDMYRTCVPRTHTCFLFLTRWDVVFVSFAADVEPCLIASSANWPFKRCA